MSPPDESSLRDLAAAYALGALSPEETRAFESYLATSAEARQEVAELRETAALLALGGPEAEPAPGSARAGARRDRPRASSGPLPSLAERRVEPDAGVSPLLWGAARGVAPHRGRTGPPLPSDWETSWLSAGPTWPRATARSRSRRVSLADPGQRLAATDSTLASLLSPGVQLVQLTASGDPEPQIQLFWDRRHNTAVLHASKLRPVPAGSHLPALVHQGRKAGAVDHVQRRARGRSARAPGRRCPSEGRLSAAAVTEEPAGGSQQPTTPILLVGTLAKS